MTPSNRRKAQGANSSRMYFLKDERVRIKKPLSRGKGLFFFLWQGLIETSYLYIGGI